MLFDHAIEEAMALLPIEGPPGREAAVAEHIRARLVDIGVPAENMRHDTAQDQSEYWRRGR